MRRHALPSPPLHFIGQVQAHTQEPVHPQIPCIIWSLTDHAYTYGDHLVEHITLANLGVHRNIHDNWQLSPCQYTACCQAMTAMRVLYGRRLAAGKSVSPARHNKSFPRLHVGTQILGPHHATGYQGYDPPLPKTQRDAAAKISARERVYFCRLATNQPVPGRRGSP